MVREYFMFKQILHICQKLGGSSLHAAGVARQFYICIVPSLICRHKWTSHLVHMYTYISLSSSVNVL